MTSSRDSLIPEKTRPSGYLMGPPRFSPSRPGFLNDRVLSKEVPCFYCKDEPRPGSIQLLDNAGYTDCIMCIKEPKS